MYARLEDNFELTALLPFLQCRDYWYAPPHLDHAVLGIEPWVLCMLGKHSAN